MNKVQIRSSSERSSSVHRHTHTPPRFTPSLSAVTIPSFLLFTMKCWAGHKKKGKRKQTPKVLCKVVKNVLLIKFKKTKSI